MIACSIPDPIRYRPLGEADDPEPEVAKPPPPLVPRPRLPMDDFGPPEIAMSSRLPAR